MTIVVFSNLENTCISSIRFFNLECHKNLSFYYSLRHLQIFCNYGQVIKTDGCFYKAGLDTKFYCFIWYLQFSPEVFFWMSFFCNPCTFWEYMSVYSQFFYGTEIIPELRSGLNTAENSVI